MDPPISPAPTTAARLRELGEAISLGEVISKPPGPVEIYVVELVTGPVGVHVGQDTQAARGGPDDIELAGTQQRDVPEPHRACGSGREHRHEVARRGEDDADEVVVAELVLLEKGIQQFRDANSDLFGYVGFDGRRPANCPHVRRHGYACYRAARRRFPGLRGVERSRGDACSLRAFTSD